MFALPVNAGKRFSRRQLTLLMESVVLSESAPTAQSEPSQVDTYLPDAPLVTIKPSGSWVSLGLHDIWVYRELLYFLIWRDVKVRYKQAALGILWVICDLQSVVEVVWGFGDHSSIRGEISPKPGWRVFIFKKTILYASKLHFSIY